MRSPTRTMAATVLTFEAMVVFFAGLVAMNLSGLDRGLGLGVFSALAVACLLVAGLLRRPAGFTAGWVVQVLVVASGFFVPMMVIVGLLFAALWFFALRIGRRIERDQALVADRLAREG